ncbi:MAG: 2OG-Fe(II) oxygenase [Candidatus Melainabacteria bacterium]|nr:2OG-Fe(II) oxygenase [Candidatus Melainabacteria bacterium]
MFFISDFKQLITVLMLMEEPRVYLFSNFLSKEEASWMVSLSEEKLNPSTVVDKETGDYVEHPHRTSSGTYFRRAENDLVTNIEARIEQITQIPAENGEGIQILKYGIGGEYRPHFDYFPPELPGSQKTLERHGQRIATLIMFLNTVQDGGETIFPTLKLKFKPVVGNALLFYNLTPDGAVDPRTLHGGAPVLQGEKWIATKWLRTQVYD